MGVTHFMVSSWKTFISQEEMGGANTRYDPGIQEHDTDMLFIGGKSYKKYSMEVPIRVQGTQSIRVLEHQHVVRPWQYDIIKGGFDNVDLGEEALHLDLGPSKDLLFLNNTRGMKGSTFTFIECD